MRSSKILILSTILLSSLALGTGCTLLKQGGATPVIKEETTTEPQAPVVVDGVRTSYADIVSKASPAVVQIRSVIKAGTASRSEGPFPIPGLPRPDAQPRQGSGSGVIVDANGTILTNHHVIDKASSIEVETSEGDTYTAELVGSDPPSDLAVLKIKGESFPFLKLGDSEKVRVGDIVLAIGNPLGIGQTVTSGIISAKGRRTSLGTETTYQNFLQTDAPINQGNSGGALVNVNGELIGINSQILSRSGGSIGIGFSVPSNMAADVLKQLVETGKVRRGLLGVNIQPLDKDLAKTFGVEDGKGSLVSRVAPDGAAAKAGVKRDDVLRKVDGESVSDPNALRNKIARTKPGTDVKLTLIRDKKEIEITVTLGELEPVEETVKASSTDEDAAQSENKKLGISVSPVTPELSSKFKLGDDTKGLVITAVDGSGPAATAGLRPGDVILEVNRTKVSSIAEMRDAVTKSGDGAAILFVQRGEVTIYITVKP